MNNTPQAADLFAQLNRQHKAGDVQRLNPGRAAGPAPAMYLITLPACADAQRPCGDYQQSGLFRYVELERPGRGRRGCRALCPTMPCTAGSGSLKNTGYVQPVLAARAGGRYCHGRRLGHQRAATRR